MEERRSVAIDIARPVEDVERFLRERRNWPLWASGLATGIEKTPEGWIVQQAEGPARLRFLSDAFGIHDHVVTLADGQDVGVPMRAEAAGEGTRVSLTLVRQPETSDAVFERDAAWMLRDLTALKGLLEAGSPGAGGTP